MAKNKKKIIYPSYDAWAKKQRKSPEFRAGQKEAAILLRLAELREKRGLSQRALAQKIGMKQSAVARIESGGQNITLETLTRLADFYGKKLELV